jgi:hypothetical protein
LANKKTYPLPVAASKLGVVKAGFDTALPDGSFSEIKVGPFEKSSVDVGIRRHGCTFMSKMD